MLAMLALRANQPVSTDSLTEGLWRDEPPASAAIADICRRLDGLPLAIELAAARTPVLGAQELSKRLGETLDLLTGGSRDAPERHRTLRATVEWSHSLLDPEEAEAFARFAVFAGGATVEAAAEVTGANLDTLAGLVDKHLLSRRPGPGEEPRLAMLETIREYAVERLDEREDAPEVRARHCRHYRVLAERAEPELFAHGESGWMPRLEAEIGNLRAAHDWSVVHEPVEALRLVPVLSTFSIIRGGLDEAVELANASLAAAGEEGPIRERARAHVELAIAVNNLGSPYDVEGSIRRARAHAADSLALYRELDDHAGIGWGLVVQAWCERGAPLPQRTRLALADEALRSAREAGDGRLTALALLDRALSLPPDEAREDFERAEAALRGVGNPRGVIDLYAQSAQNSIRTGCAERAGPWLAEALSLARALGDPGDLLDVLAVEGVYRVLAGEVELAERAFDEHLRLCRDTEFVHDAPTGLAGLAATAASAGENDRAARLLGAATALGPINDAEVMVQLEEHFFAPARARLGEPAWNEACGAASAMSADDAIAFALDR